MKNFLVWIVLISTAAVGVAVAQPTSENGYAVNSAQDIKNVWVIGEPLSKKV